MARDHAGGSEVALQPIALTQPLASTPQPLASTSQTLASTPQPLASTSGSLKTGHTGQFRLHTHIPKAKGSNKGRTPLALGRCEC
eukprot:5839899-Pyramimonas_sp.AAC.2